MYLDTPDGRVKAVVQAVRPDGSFDWVSECGNFSGLGSKLKLQDGSGYTVKPAAQPGALEAMQTEIETLKSQISQQTVKIADMELKVKPSNIEPVKEEQK